MVAARNLPAAQSHGPPAFRLPVPHPQPSPRLPAPLQPHTLPFTRSRGRGLSGGCGRMWGERTDTPAAQRGERGSALGLPHPSPRRCHGNACQAELDRGWRGERRATADRGSRSLELGRGGSGWSASRLTCTAWLCASLLTPPVVVVDSRPEPPSETSQAWSCHYTAWPNNLEVWLFPPRLALSFLPTIFF